MARVDCLQRITTSHYGRDPERLRRKYAAMREDAFAFLRGTCHLFYEDWPHLSPLNDAPRTWICGDLHLENFGSYKGDNRLTYFDLSDFDESVLAPCTWDVARFLTSVLVGAHTLQIESRLALALCTVFLQAYATALADGKARWVERATARGMVKDLLQGLRKRRRADFLDSRTKRQGRKRRLRLDGKRALPVDDQQAKNTRRQLAEQIDNWRSISSASQLDLIDHSDLLLSDILDTCGDRKNTAAYLKIIKDYPEPVIRMALSETHQAHLEGRIAKSRGAYFTDTLKRLAQYRATRKD